MWRSAVTSASPRLVLVSTSIHHKQAKVLFVIRSIWFCLTKISSQPALCCEFIAWAVLAFVLAILTTFLVECKRFFPQCDLKDFVIRNSNAQYYHGFVRSLRSLYPPTRGVVPKQDGCHPGGKYLPISYMIPVDSRSRSRLIAPPIPVHVSEPDLSRS